MDSTLNSSAVVKKLECPFAIKWEIEENKLAALKNSKNGYLETEPFEASNMPGVVLHLVFCPNGNKEEDRGKVWMFLFIKHSNETKVKAVYKFFIQSVDGIYNFNHEFDKFEGWGGTRFTTDEFFDPEKKFFVDGKLNIKCHGTLLVERESPSPDTSTKWKEESFLIELWNRNDADFAFSVGDKSIQAHKSILSLRSSFFKTIFDSGIKVENTLDVAEFSYETVELAIQLLYDHQISTFTMEEKLDVLKFFDKFKFFDLKESLELLLAEDITLTTVVSIANFSRETHSINLRARCKDFMVACFRMDQLILNFKDLQDKTFALNVLECVHYNITKT